MPLEGDAPNIVEYKMPINGVNLNDGRLEIVETQALQLKNLYVRGGIKKRGGYSKENSEPIEGGVNSVTLLHRFYKQDDSSELITGAGTGVYLQQTETQTSVLSSAGTIIGDADSQEANAFDDDTTKTGAESATKTSDTSFLIGKDWGSGIQKFISGFTVVNSSDQGFVNGIDPNVTIVLEGSNDNFVADTDTLATITAFADSNSATKSDLSVSVIIISLNSTNVINLTSANEITLEGHRYHRLNITHDGAAADMYVAEITFFTTTVWNQLASGLTANTPACAETWGAKDKVYIANGVDSGLVYDGSTTVDFSTLLAGIVPIQFLEYQDRLLMLSTTEPGALRWCASFDDTSWVSAAATGIRPDSRLHGMIIHSAADNQEQGQNAQVLLAGSSGMYLFSGTNLSLTFSNYTIQQLATKVGCNAPKTMQWTPMGTMWLGTDGQVYLLPFQTLVPIPVGENINSRISGFVGLDGVSATTMSTARAVYQDGYYKLTFPASGASINTDQWWLDIFSAFNRSNAQSVVNRALSVGWFGPMTGMTFSEMIVKSGSGDLGELIAGEGDTTVGSFVYTHNGDDLTDDGSDITWNWVSWYNPVSSPFLNTVAHHIEVELLNTVNDINITYKDSAGGSSNSTTLIEVTGTGSFYNEAYFGEFYYGGLDQARIREGIVPPLKQRFVAVDMSGVSDQKVEIYAFRLEESQQSAPLDDRR